MITAGKTSPMDAKLSGEKFEENQILKQSKSISPQNIY